ncbi:MAG: hypothetical protein GXY32_02090 [Ruminococcaceae bacterium]|nr:hypothetical protein [Oscillospiraceae bacterium]
MAMLKWIKSHLALLLAGLILVGLAACTGGGQAASGGDGPESSGVGSVPVVDASDASAAADSASEESRSALPDNSTPVAVRPVCFFDQVADAVITAMALPADADDTARVLAAYRAVIARTVYVEFDDPLLTESWRYADRCGQAPSAYQAAALGPLYYGIGTCENFSAALMVLLERMGYETLYVAGRTWSYDGRLVDHAWVMVCLDDVWYHIDPQLEDNVIRGGLIEYRYFLKGDADFLAHHVWGAALPKPDAHSLALPACPQSAPALEAGTIEQDPAPASDALHDKAARLQKAAIWAPSRLAVAGSLPPLPRYVEADPALQA